MDAVIIVEVLDKSGAVRERHRLMQFPAGIGRGYSNAVLLDDEYVAARHGEIFLQDDGSLAYRDLASENGSVLDGKAINSCCLRADQTLVLGRSRVRLRTPDCSVPPAHRLAARDESLLQWRPGWGLAFLAPVAPAITIGLLNYAHQFNDPQRLKSLGIGLITFLLLSLWSGVWALLGRLFVQQTAFRAHVVVASLGLFAAELLNLALDPLSAFTAWLPGSDYLMLALVVVPVVIGIISHLRLSTHMQRRQALLRTLAACAAVGVILGVMDYADQQDFSDNPDIAIDVQPVPGHWIPAGSAPAYFKDARSLEKDAQQSP